MISSYDVQQFVHKQLGITGWRSALFILWWTLCNVAVFLLGTATSFSRIYNCRIFGATQ
jgi:hypothetical protein